MSYYHLPSNIERNPGRFEIKLSDGARLSAPDGRWTDELAALCGFVRIAQTERPADTDTVTYTRSVELVDDAPTVMWTAREWTEEELLTQRIDNQQLPIEARLDALAVLLVEPLIGDELTAEQEAAFVPMFPLWQVGIAVTVGRIYRWDDHLVRCVQAHTTQADWTPDVTPALWTRIVPEVGDGPQPWIQPQGGHDAYPVGARVTHNGQTWESTTPANVWEPGVFGWVVV